MARTNTRYVLNMLTLILSAVLFGNSSTVLAQAKKSDSVVKVDAQADKPDADGRQTITITLSIEKGWHIYANPVGNEDLANAQTVVRIVRKAERANQGVQAQIEYPEGKLQQDNGEKFKIYEGKVVIKAQVKRVKGDDSPLEISVTLQACNDKTCLPPVTVKKEIP